jgi:phospholipase C
VHNASYLKWAKNTAPTIFERLADALPLSEAFRIYWDPQDPFPITRLIHRPLYERRFDASFVDMHAFERDCAAGSLPAYSFIQPRVIVDNNDMHPSFLPQQNRHSSVLGGDALVARVYDALRTSPLWPRSLLVILFDEHGGTYDHVPPPLCATPPHKIAPYPLEHGFRFERFGVRVPAVFVSPYIEAGTVVRARGEVPFDHTSVIKTLCLRFGLSSLTDRDRAAPDFLHVLNRRADAPPRQAPTFTPRPQPPSKSRWSRRLLLSDLQRGTLELLAYQRGLSNRGFATLGEALDLLHGLRRRPRDPAK